MWNMFRKYIYICGIYKRYKRNSHKYLWYQIIRNTGAAFGSAPRGRPPKASGPIGSVFLIILYHTCLWIFHIYIYIPSIFHIYFLNMLHRCSLVCFIIYGVKRRSGHDGSQSFCLIWHVSGPKMVFWRNDIMILHHYCWRSSKIKLFWTKPNVLLNKFIIFIKPFVLLSKFMIFWQNHVFY